MNSKKEQRIQAFVQLGKVLALWGKGSKYPDYSCGLTEDEYFAGEHIVKSSHTYNGWFTENEVRKMFRNWSEQLKELSLQNWLENQPYGENSSSTVAVICAGNIPMVGFHDILSVLCSGHKALVKLSSDDAVLIPLVIKIAMKFDSSIEQDCIFATGKLVNFNAVIATGSNSSAIHFENYFGKYPHIIRSHRTSVAILSGSETEDELQLLGEDIFDYFGLGCRNVTKIYVPESYDLNTIFKAIFPFQEIKNHNKYANNYDYNKAVWLLNKEDLLENGFILFKQDNGLTSPVASMFYQRYSDLKELKEHLAERSNEIQ
ncbi:MAG: acyl-CoA reductase, partial [Bacteroidota bacterium]